MRPNFDPQSLVIHGMHGLGDNVMMRAPVRKWLATRPQTTFYLDSPWPCVFADLACDRLRIIRKQSRLRTQAKNAARERAKFYTGPAPTAPFIRVAYRPNDVRVTGNVLRAMMATCGLDWRDADMSMPFRQEWGTRAAELIRTFNIKKPILFCRPPTLRQEWLNDARNPDPTAFAALFESIRKEFFVVSVADLAPNIEWVDGVRVSADLALHSGQLNIEDIMALMAYSALVFCPPGFATVLAMAIGTPVVTVFGGYQCGRTLDFAPPKSRHLFIDPITPCDCFSHSHACQKSIDLPAALDRLQSFVGSLTAPRG